MNKWIFSIFTFHCVWIHTFPVLRMKFYFHYSYHFCGCVVHPPRNSVCLVLSIGVNFLLHHRNRANWILLAYQVQFVHEWRSSWLAFIHYSNLGTTIFLSLIRLPSNFSSMQWIVMLVRFIYGLVLLHSPCSSMFWTAISQVSSCLKL